LSAYLFDFLPGGAIEEVAPAVSPTTPKPRLHFYRCTDCLSICTSPEQLSYRDQRGYTVAGGNAAPVMEPLNTSAERSATA